MPDRRSHRGPDPQDEKLFAESERPRLRRAVADLSYLRTREYGESSAIELVGNRYRLKRRQRTAVQRAASGDEDLADRLDRRVELEDAPGQPLLVDGFNLLITVESALGGAPLIRSRDGCFRDLSGLHGTYRRVEETGPALDLIERALREAGREAVHWYLDRPVSNCKRAAGWIRELGAEWPGPWTIDLVEHVDEALLERSGTVATTDAPVIQAADRWTDLAGRIVAEWIPNAWIVDLRPD